MAPVSVIIPCYNSVKTLERAVKSVANQSLKPNQLILVDDGSTDQTVNFMYQLQKKYGEDWIDIIELGADLGVSTARNSGWEKATEEFVAFLDSDDAWHPQKVKTQLNIMLEQPNLKISGHDFSILNPDSEFENFEDKPKIEKISFKKLLMKNFFITPSVMIKRDVDYRFQAGRSDMDDHLLWLELAHTYGPIVKIKQPLAAIFKAQWGEGGLNSRLWTMEKGNHKNFIHLWKSKKINLLTCIFLMSQSLARFTRRVFIQYVWRKLLPTKSVSTVSH